MTEQERLEILTAIETVEERISKYIANLRQHEAVNLDAMVSDVRQIRRDLGWLKNQWEKFSRPTDTQ